MKLSLILGGLLVVTIGSSAWYIDYLNDQIITLRANQVVLETEIEKQNESIKNYLAEQKNQQNQCFTNLIYSPSFSHKSLLINLLLHPWYTSMLKCICKVYQSTPRLAFLN